jgi:hypothetical protein
MIAGIFVVLIFFALIAAIWGRDKAQGAFHAVFGTLSILVIIGITVVDPIIGGSMIALVAIITFSVWAAKASKAKTEEIRIQGNQWDARRSNYAIGEMQKMLDVVNASAEYTRRLSSPPIQPQISPEPSFNTRGSGPLPPPRSVVAPPPPIQTATSSPILGSAPPILQLCLSCRSQYTENQKFCSQCGSPIIVN